MSLMNDMLRDLEKRQAPDRTQQVEAQGYGALTQKTEAHSSRAVILLLGVIIIMLLALAVGWWYIQTQTTPQNKLEVEAVKNVAPVNEIELSRDSETNKDKQVDNDPVVSNNVVAKHIVTVKDKVIAPETVSENADSAARKEPPKKSVVLAAQTVQAASERVSNVEVEESPVPESIAVAPPSKKNASPVEAQNLSDQSIPKQDVAPKGVAANNVDVKNVDAKNDAAQAVAKTNKQSENLASTMVDNSVNDAEETVPLSKVLVISAEQRDENAANAAEDLIENGNLQTAKAELKTFIEANNVDVKSRALLVTLLMQDGDMAGANALLTANKLSMSSHLRRLKAHWLAQSGQPDEAIALLNSARPNIEEDPEYQVLLAALYQQQGFSTEAVAVYAELLGYSPDVADWWAGMAIALDSSQQYPSAKKAYQKALQMEGLKFELADFARQRLVTLGQ